MATPSKNLGNMANMSAYRIAQVCHEANRAYCLTIGDSSQPEWEDAPGWQKDSAVNGVNAHWAVLEEGKQPNPRESHENWLREKTAAGWKYGSVKDPDKKEHPCFVPYDDLPSEQKMKDYIFVGVVKSFWEAAHSQH